MTPADYRAAIQSLGLTQAQAANKLGVSLRTSNEYARRGAPERVRLALDALKSQAAK